MNTFRDPHNLLFRLARQGRRLTRWWAVPLLLLLFTLAGAPGLLVALEPASESGLWRSALETAAFFVASYLPVALLVGLWIWRREGRGPETLGLRRNGAARYSLHGFLFGSGLIALGVVLIVTTGDATITFDQGKAVGWIAIAPGLVVLAGWAIQGTTEELMFRGWMLQNSGAQIGPLAGIAFTTVFFTFLHLGNPGITALSVVNLFLVGVLFALIALLEGGIWAASACHVSWNWAQSNVFGLNVSGLEVGGGSFVRVVPDDTNASILGGEFGFEGSVAATITLVIGIVIVLALSVRE